MKYFSWMYIIIFSINVQAQELSGDEILKKVDQNMFADNKIIISRMIIHGRRDSRTIQAKSWQRGTTDAFTEYLAPAREKGTKMLKLGDNLWMYSPSTDRTIMISGHMLRQSVMGSDLSYEDMMEDPHLPNLYSAKIISSEKVNERECYVLELTAKKEEISYYSRKLWIDKSRFVVMRENLFAKSGKLLKTIEVRDVMQIKKYWIIKSAIFKDAMKNGEGTEFFIDEIQVDVNIPEYIFSKAALKK